MKYSYNWLKQLSNTNFSPEKAAELLTMHSFELEGTEEIGKEFDGIVVGKILEIGKHSNADKLQIVKVDIGKEKLEIVCGAFNIKIGDKVPVALAGTKLPGGMTIKEVDIRGIKSNGMLCSEDELGIGKDNLGIFILDENAKIGTPLSKYWKMEDTVFDIKVLPDRAHDAMSHVGVARELSALSRKNIDYDFSGLRLPKRNSKKLKIKILDKKLCPRYAGAVLENIEIKPSPIWMRIRLIACGIRPINNVVDATNYVMLELGHPLHAFDAEKITNNQKTEIVIRRAKKDEKMMLLDDTEIKLTTEDLLITNGEIPLALAGVMGGKNSGISKDTKTIILESANFNPLSIRKSRMRHNLKTEASDRYEKGIDPNMAEKAMVRAIEILERTANAKLEGITDAYPAKIKPWKIKLDLDYVRSLLGEDIIEKEIKKILEALEIKTEAKKAKTLACIIPTFRIDIKTQEDLIEEIGRIWGYENIKPRPLVEAVISPEIDRQLSFEKKIKIKMIGLGFDEIYNYSFYSRTDADACGLGQVSHLELKNPMNSDQALVRRNLVPNILKNIKENLRNFDNFSIFEIGRAYFKQNGKIQEKRMLVAGKVLERDKKNETFFELKGTLEDFLESLNINSYEVRLRKNSLGLWHPERSAEIKIDGNTVGIIGEINLPVLANYKIGKRVAMFELDLEKLLRVSQKETVYQPIRKFPTVTRDISFLSKNDLLVADIEKFIRKIGQELVIDVKLFDIFQKDAQTSFAFHIEFGAEKTLKGREVDEVMEKITKSIEKELGVEVRK